MVLAPQATFHEWHRIPGRPGQEDGITFVEAAIRVGLACVVAITILIVLMHVAASAISADAPKRGQSVRFRGYPDGSSVESWRRQFPLSRQHPSNRHNQTLGR